MKTEPVAVRFRLANLRGTSQNPSSEIGTFTTRFRGGWRDSTTTTLERNIVAILDETPTELQFDLDIDGPVNLTELAEALRFRVHRRVGAAYPDPDHQFGRLSFGERETTTMILLVYAHSEHTTGINNLLASCNVLLSLNFEGKSIRIVELTEDHAQELCFKVEDLLRSKTLDAAQDGASLAFEFTPFPQ